MKKIIIFLTVLSIALNCFSQQTDSLRFIRSSYLLKSKNQKTAAWVLLGGGVALSVTGMVIYTSAYKKAVDENPFYLGTNANPAGAALATVGILASIGSIPLFIASGKNKRKALAISTGFKMEKASVIQGACFVKKSYPALSVKIRL